MMLLDPSSGKQLVHSASDLTAFLECEALTALNLQALSDPALAAQRVLPDEGTQLITDKGIAHEQAYLKRLLDAGLQVVDVAALAGRDPLDRLSVTRQAMAQGADVVYQAALMQGDLLGYADFLMRVPTPSGLGEWSYEVADTKLARSTKAKFLVQLSFYSHLLAPEQSLAPRHMHLVLGDQTQATFSCTDYGWYVRALTERYRETVMALQAGTRQAAYPVACAHCDMCEWRAHCEARRLADDHLCQVAGVRKQQILKLEAANVHTMAQLAELPETTRIPKLNPDTLAKLRRQARLQTQGKTDGRLHYELLSVTPDVLRGFARMPEPDEGDIFFDMEGNPLQDGGLEYLFGLWFRENGQWQFQGFWAHDRVQERRAFEDCIDFIVQRWQRYPHMHVYHYASYEETAFKRLSSTHGTRGHELDELLRRHVLVDLYKVVREALCISQPSYSIKYVEHFYRGNRTGDVTNAGASIVYYERWLQTQDAQLLRDIEDYNRDDVESTQQLRDWLLTLRPATTPWRQALPYGGSDDETQSAPRSKAALEAQARIEAYRQRLLGDLPADPHQWTPEQQLRGLTFDLLGFHRRTVKPQWWSIFSKAGLSEEELIDDPECLSGLRLDPNAETQHLPVVGRRRNAKTHYTYLVPEQNSKLGHDLRCTYVHSANPASVVRFDESAGRVTLEVDDRDPPLPEIVHLGPAQPLDQKPMEAALFMFADSLLDCRGTHEAALQFLRRDLPRISGHAPGQPIIPEGADLLQACISAVTRLDRSYLYVQGPPGAGKTYAGSRMIAALLAKGLRVGVMSNSHKAIHHLMTGAIRAAQDQGIPVRAVKKASRGSPDSELPGNSPHVVNVFDNKDVAPQNGNLIGGTAWLFCLPSIEVDCLFVDEAGQVSLANLVACSGAAKNLVLLGDQMQLSQPTQGVHPGRSGDSALDYLLDGQATIAPGKGIFLGTSWRMHPDVCSFISEAVYDGRLLPEPHNKNRTLVLGDGAHRLLKASGIVHVPIQHEDCSQRSEPEAALTREIYESALQQHYTDEHGVRHRMTHDNILVVAPYNLQVKLLQQRLPDGARVGTVDKFQGQEAELVIVSMTTSSQEDLPRHVGFLYSKNRLNVAVSRAKCTAIVLANPALLAIKCEQPEEMALVNTLCWLAQGSTAKSMV